MNEKKSEIPANKAVARVLALDSKDETEARRAAASVIQQSSVPYLSDIIVTSMKEFRDLPQYGVASGLMALVQNLPYFPEKLDAFMLWMNKEEHMLLLSNFIRKAPDLEGSVMKNLYKSAERVGLKLRDRVGEDEIEDLLGESSTEQVSTPESASSPAIGVL